MPGSAPERAALRAPSSNAAHEIAAAPSPLPELIAPTNKVAAVVAEVAPRALVWCRPTAMAVRIATVSTTTTAKVQPALRRGADSLIGPRYSGWSPDRGRLAMARLH